jgi:hypothetical protein
MHKSPLQTYKESCFTYNKLDHSKLLPIFYFSCMAIESSFTANVSPPHACSISLTRKCHSLNSTSSSITMKKHYCRYSQPLNALRCLRRPRGRVDLVKPMMRSSIRPSLHIFLLSKKRITCIFIFNKKSHYLYKIIK